MDPGDYVVRFSKDGYTEVALSTRVSDTTILDAVLRTTSTCLLECTLPELSGTGTLHASLLLTIDSRIVDAGPISIRAGLAQLLLSVETALGSRIDAAARFATGAVAHGTGHVEARQDGLRCVVTLLGVRPTSLRFTAGGGPYADAEVYYAIGSSVGLLHTAADGSAHLPSYPDVADAHLVFWGLAGVSAPVHIQAPGPTVVDIGDHGGGLVLVLPDRSTPDDYSVLATTLGTSEFGPRARAGENARAPSLRFYVPPGAYQVQWKRHVILSDTFDVTQGALTYVDLRELYARSQIVGRVTDHANVRLWSTAVGRPRRLLTSTDIAAASAFSFADLPPGQYTVTVDFEQGSIARHVHLGGGESADLGILSPSDVERVSVTIVDADGRPAAGRSVTAAILPTRSNPPRKLVASTDGIVQVSAPAAAALQLSLASAGRSWLVVVPEQGAARTVRMPSLADRMVAVGATLLPLSGQALLLVSMPPSFALVTLDIDSNGALRVPVRDELQYIYAETVNGQRWFGIDTATAAVTIDVGADHRVPRARMPADAREYSTRMTWLSDTPLWLLEWDSPRSVISGDIVIRLPHASAARVHLFANGGEMATIDLGEQR
jgi:hypothetical protein